MSSLREGVVNIFDISGDDTVCGGGGGGGGGGCDCAHRYNDGGADGADDTSDVRATPAGTLCVC